MITKDEAIARQLSNALNVKRIWGDILINAKAFGAKGDGVTDDTGVFGLLESMYEGMIINLAGGKYVVTEEFSKNMYVNGEFIINGVSYQAPYVDVIRSGNSNIFLGEDAGKKNLFYSVYPDGRGCYSNVGIGDKTLAENIKGWRNIAIGDHTMSKNTHGYFNTAVGDQALVENIGDETPSSNAGGSRNTAIGSNCLRFNTYGAQNTAIGRNAFHTNTTGSFNVAVGSGALSGMAPFINGEVVNQTPKNCNNVTAIGYNALFWSNGNFNTAVGAYAGNNIKEGINNVAIGGEALQNLEIDTEFGDDSDPKSGNTAVGTTALKYMIDGSPATSIRNCVGIGINSRVSGNNQVQLGGSGTTVYAYGAVQDRSDARDKTDIRDTILGLEFIKKLRPVDFKWDMRDDYLEENEDGELVAKPKDGSKKRKRYHHGLIAQEVKQVLDEMGIDFGGYQDHKINGGNDILTIGYTELIAPLIKAVQELSSKVEELQAKVE